MTKLGLVAAVAITLGAAPAAHAFGGLYVAPGDAPLVNDATQVAIIRDGTRTVVSMQPSYQGSAEAFALVIPVPAALQQGDVKVLAPDVLGAVELLGAPRLVEYWEQDPCKVEVVRDDEARGREPGVSIESQTAAGEYQISIVSVKNAAGLEAWLRREGYQLSAATEALLQSYVDSGMKLLVAKVDPKKVARAGGRAVLSPLRFHYDSEHVSLPIRLGLTNSGGTQDLIVNVLAPHQRYEVANYPNVTIPTNLTVRSDVRDKVGAFYVALFDATVAKHPGAIVTEYARVAHDDALLQALGADVAGDRDFVLTRLHARYGKSIKADLELKPAPPIAGGREHVASSGNLEQGAQSAATNDFQARYAIRHAWTGPITCTNPVRGRWGGKVTKPALDLALAPRGNLELASTLVHDIPEIGLFVNEDALALAPSKYARGPQKAPAGCGCETGDPTGSLALAVVGVLVGLVRRPRSARR